MSSSSTSRSTRSIAVTSTSTSNALNPGAAEAAYRTLAKQLAEIPRDQLVTVNVDLQTAAVFAMGVGRLVTDPPVRARFAKLGKTGEYDDGCADALGPAAQAAWYARHRYMLATATRSEARLALSLVEEATALKVRMLRLADYWLSDTPALAAEITAIRAGSGHQDLANDLIALAALLERNHDEVSQDKKLFRKGDTARGKALAGEILEQLGAAASPEESEWAAAQPRVWTHLLGTYEEVQRGGLFLFAHDKADERFPSLVTVGRSPASARPAKADTGTGDTGSGPRTDETGHKGGDGSGNPPA